MLSNTFNLLQKMTTSLIGHIFPTSRWFIISLLLLLGQNTQAGLNAGDIAFVQYNATGTDNFAFVALVDIPEGEIIKFTDNGWYGSHSGFRENEGVITWTAPTAVSAGTVITIDNTPTATTGSVTKSDSLDFSASGDQLIAYQDTHTMLAALNNKGSATWQADATDSNTSALPQGLTNGVNAVAVQEKDNIKYTGPTSGDKTALLTALNDSIYWIGDNSTTPQSFTDTFTIGLAATFTTASQQVLESSDTTTITVKLSGISSEDVIVPFTVFSILAIQGVDYAITSNFLTIPAGSTTADITIILIDDIVNEINKKFIVIMETPTHAIQGVIANHTIIIQDDDVNLVINEVDYNQPNSDTAEFVEIKNVTASPINLSGYTIEFFTDATDSVYRTIPLPNIDLAGGDYYVVCGNSTTVANCDLVVSPSTDLIQNALLTPDAIAIRQGSSFVDAISYKGNIDPWIYYTETMGTSTIDSSTEALVGLSRYPDGTDTNHNNNDFALKCITPGEPNNVNANNHCFTLSINSPTAVMEGDGSTTTVSFTVTLSHPAPANVTVQYTTLDSTTMADSDYISTSGIVTFIPGQTTQTINVTVYGDNIDEDDETFKVVLSSPSHHAQLSTNIEGIATIIDDDMADFAMSKTTASVSQSGKVDTFQVVLIAQPTSDITISITSADTTKVNVTPAILTFTTADWNIPQTVTVSGVDDGIATNYDQIVPITLSIISGSINNTTSEVTVTLTEGKKNNDLTNSYSYSSGLSPLPPTMNLKIDFKGDGQGSVKIQQGKDFPGNDFYLGTCTHEEDCFFKDLETASWVIITPQAQLGSEFKGWGGSSYCNDGHPFMIANMSCIAYFNRVPVITLPSVIADSTPIEREPNSSAPITDQAIPPLEEVIHQPAMAPVTSTENGVPPQDEVPNVFEPAIVPSVVESLMPEQTLTVIPEMVVETRETLPNHDILPEPEKIETDQPIPQEEDAFCPTKTWLDGACNAGGREIVNLTILPPAGILANAIITGWIDNQSWIGGSITVKPSGQIHGGKVTGSVENQGIISDFEFVGAEIVGGTLAGHIINHSKVRNRICDVHLAADTYLHGGERGKLCGQITGDRQAPALLESVTIVTGTVLENVMLGQGVILEAGVILGAHVHFVTK